MCELLKQVERDKKTLKVSELAMRCRYHKNNQQRYGFNEYFKDFKCLELFHAIYPKALALMYDGLFSDKELIINCPNIDNTVTVRLVTEPVRSIVKKTVNRVKEFLWILRPMDVVKIVVFVEVVSVLGVCRAGHRLGDKLEIYHKNTMCPQALYSVFPAVLLSEEGLCCQCPSSVNKVAFQVEKQ